MNYIEKIDKIDKVIDRLIDKIIIYCIKREEREKKELKIFLFSLRTMDLFVDGSCEISLLCCNNCKNNCEMATRPWRDLEQKSNQRSK